MAKYLRLDEVCFINMGQSPESKSYNENGDGLPFFQGNADFGDLYPTVRMWCNEPTKVVDPGTLLISVRAPIGALNFATEKSCIGRGLAGVTPNATVDIKYIYYCLKGKLTELIAKGTGSTFKAIAKNALAETIIKVIPLWEQRIVVETIDKVSSIISARQQQLSALDTLIKARFVEMFGEPSRNPYGFDKQTLRNTCKVITGNTPPRSVDRYYGDFIEWIKTDNIVSGKLYPTVAVEYLSDEGMKVSRTVEENTILMVCIAGSVASIGRVCLTDRKVAFNQQINAVIPQKYNPLFLFVMLQVSKDYLTQEINMALKGILSKSKLESKEFFVPPMERQEEFAAFVAQIDKSKSVVQEALDKALLLFDSLMQKYFG